MTPDELLKFVALAIPITAAVFAYIDGSRSRKRDSESVGSMATLTKEMRAELERKDAQMKELRSQSEADLARCKADCEKQIDAHRTQYDNERKEALNEVIPAFYPAVS